MIEHLSEREFWAYFSGFFDGEGCVATIGSREAASLRISQGGDEGKSLLEEFSWLLRNRYMLPGKMGIYKVGYSGERNFKGKLTRRRQDVYTLTVASREAVIFVLKNMLPYLAIKKDKAQDVVRFCKMFPVHFSHLSRKPKKLCKYGHPWIPSNIVRVKNGQGKSYNACIICRSMKRKVA